MTTKMQWECKGEPGEAGKRGEAVAEQLALRFYEHPRMDQDHRPAGMSRNALLSALWLAYVQGRADEHEYPTKGE